MKKYQSHKIVEAAEIYMACLDDEGGCHVYLEPQAEHVAMPDGAFARGMPAKGDYLVRYQPDGYLSWSPKAVFEAGYREIEARGAPAAVEVTVTAPAGKRADVSLGRPGGSTSWTVTEGQSQAWSVVVGEALVVCEGEPHSTVAHKRDAS